MTCAETRNLMLEADAAELTGLGASTLAAHLRECADCRAMAAHLVEAQRTLAATLTAAAPHGTVDSALRRASRGGYRRWAWRVAPLAAAAVVAALLVGRRPPVDRVSPSAYHRFRGVIVEPPRGRSVAIMQADNPNIVVIWFF
ncbi:MAG TPA: hypothetical protein VH439_00715 [Gemmatimonadales bacterium]|jgi:predicted anti-sigma-YlaC factor YlaD